MHGKACKPCLDRRPKIARLSDDLDERGTKIQQTNKYEALYWEAMGEMDAFGWLTSSGEIDVPEGRAEEYVQVCHKFHSVYISTHPV